jgi:hypothetical protein
MDHQEQLSEPFVAIQVDKDLNLTVVQQVELMDEQNLGVVQQVELVDEQNFGLVNVNVVLYQCFELRSCPCIHSQPVVLVDVDYPDPVQ